MQTQSLSRKSCFKCGEEKPMEDFYRHKMMADGHLNKCKECAKKDVRLHRQTSSAPREYDLRRAKTPRRLKQRRAQVERQRSRDPDGCRRRREAHSITQRAIDSGELVREPCLVCKTDKNVYAHHEDYSKPLDVMWLCPVHHAARHKEIGYNL